MTTTIGIKDAKARFAELVGKAEAGEVVTITRNGKIVAYLSARLPTAFELAAEPDASGGVIAPAPEAAKLFAVLAAPPNPTPELRSDPAPVPDRPPAPAAPQKPGLTYADIIKASL